LSVFERLDRARAWSPDEVLVLDQVDRLIDATIAPRAANHDRTGQFPWENIKAINNLGLNAIFVPEAYGGAPMRYRLYLEVVRRLASACASTAIIYATGFHAMKPVIDFGSEHLKSKVLPCIAAGGLAALAITEPDAGSDATGMVTCFEADGEDVIINGAKTFITNGDVADVLLLFGKWRGIDEPRRAISVLVLEKGAPGFTVDRIEDKMGHRASSTAALSFASCRVPRENLVGQPGDGLAILLASLNKSRPSVAAHALGIASAAFSDAVGYMNERKQSGRRIVDFQANQFMLADHASDLAMTEAWLDHVGRLVDSGEPDFALEASIAKLKASDLAMRIATDAVQMLGGYGYTRDMRAERLMRDAKITQIWEGTNQIHRQLIGRSFATR
jgi:alkylation response protein AidB-like acyl-CoA dehydrogenase